METVNKTNKQNVKYQTKKAEILKAIQNFENKRPSRTQFVHLQVNFIYQKFEM